ncbi:MAG: hypothetical protein ACI89X_001168 [Planctomycetota bacterium]|jgi:hypothetical protein
MVRRGDGEEDPEVWEFVELTSSKELAREGVAMQPCGSSYFEYCDRGWARIWSLRSRRKGRVRSLLTIELNPPRGGGSAQSTCTTYMRSGALMPSRPSPVVNKRRAASTSTSRASRTAGSAPTT